MFFDYITNKMVEDSRRNLNNDSQKHSCLVVIHNTVLNEFCLNSIYIPYRFS